MLLKRYIPIAIVAFFGALTLSAWFIDNEAIETFANDDATQFFDIIAAFAVFLGALNLLKLQFIKVLFVLVSMLKSSNIVYEYNVYAIDTKSLQTIFISSHYPIIRIIVRWTKR